MRQRRGQIAGLHNFGRTCFLNTLLQALAACPQFIAWLQLHGNSDKKSLIGSLLSTLEGKRLLCYFIKIKDLSRILMPIIVINGTHPTLRSDPYSPGAVLRALNTLGWVIPPDEHDAHELLHVLLSSLEEEAVRPKKIGCLSDALDGMMLGGRQPHMPNARPSSAMLSDFCKSEYDESTSLMRQVRSEAHTPDSPHSVCTDADDNAEPSGYMENSLASPMIFPETRKSRSRKSQSNTNGDCLNKRQSMSCRSLERLNRGPGRISVWSEQAQIQVPHPFRGAQSSQMICSGCGYKVIFWF